MDAAPCSCRSGSPDPIYVGGVLGHPSWRSSPLRPKGLFFNASRSNILPRQAEGTKDGEGKTENP